MRLFWPLCSVLLALTLLLPPAAAGVQVGKVVSLGRTVVDTAAPPVFPLMAMLPPCWVVWSR